MIENEKTGIINDENKNYLNIITNNINNIDVNNKSHKNLPKSSDILSISTNPENIFTLLYPIGRSTFGTVYKAIHKELKKVYTIKVINFFNELKNKAINNLDLNISFQNILFNLNNFMFQQESSLKKLYKKSKYIVNYYGSYFSKKENTLWLIFEYCPSGSLLDLMQTINRAYTEEEISTIIKSILEGLIFIHSKNLNHRDIKSSNIFLSEDGQAKFGDFSIGNKLEILYFFFNNKNISTNNMESQEEKKINCDLKSDILNLGIICCEMCKGKIYFTELNQQNDMTLKVDDIINKDEHSKEFYDFVKKCLEVEPKERPSIEELIHHEFIVKYARDNKFLKELINSHIDEINQFRKNRNELKDFSDKEKINELNNNKNLNYKNFHHQKNNLSNITSHFYDDDIKQSNYKEKENLNSKKESQNKIKEEKNKFSSKSDLINFPTFHKIDEENNINDDNESFEEIKEIHSLCKSFDITYFNYENISQNNSNKINNGNKIKLTKNRNNLNTNKINLLLDKEDKKKENNINNFPNLNKMIYTKKTKNKSIDKIFSKKNKSKIKNIINKSSDNLYFEEKKSNTNKNIQNFIYTKSKIKNQGKNNFIFKKPIISSRTKKCSVINDTNRDSVILDTESEEGHINNTNLFKAKSNFDIFKIVNKEFFSKTNCLFHKNLLRLSELNINKSKINNDDENDKNISYK